MKIAVIQASLGGLDSPCKHEKQSLQHDYYLFDDNSLPPRHKAMTARLQAKIPKMFAYELKPNFEYYLWLDGNLTLNNQDTLKYFVEQIQGYDIVGLKHPRIPNVRQEIRYLRKGLREQSKYLVARYDGEFLPEQTTLIQGDKDFVDDLLLIGGIFMYRNTKEVQAMLKEWFFQVCRYNVQDQISFSYVLKKSGLKVNALDHDYRNWEYIKNGSHAKRHI